MGDDKKVDLSITPEDAQALVKVIEKIFGDFRQRERKKQQEHVDAQAKYEEKVGLKSLKEQFDKQQATDKKLLDEYRKTLEEKKALTAKSDKGRVDALKQVELLEKKIFETESKMKLDSIRYETERVAKQLEANSLTKKCQDILMDNLPIYDREVQLREAIVDATRDQVDFERDAKDTLEELEGIYEELAVLKEESKVATSEDNDEINATIELLEEQAKLLEERRELQKKAAEEAKQANDDADAQLLKVLEIKKKAAGLMQEHGIGVDYVDEEITAKETEKSNQQDVLENDLEELAELQVTIASLEKELEKAREENDVDAIEKLTKQLESANKLEEDLKDQIDATTANIGELSTEISQLELDKINSRDSKAEAKNKIQQMKEDAASKRKNAEATREAMHDPEFWAARKELKAAEREEKEANALPDFLDNLEESMDGIMGKAFNQFFEDLSKTIDSNIGSFYEHQAHMEARLQGSDETYKKVLSKMSAQLAFNPFVKQTAMIEKIREAVDAGVAYNVDLRAFLATVSDSIASTFNAFDANLLKIIRIQQADTTASRLGMEASLTKLFNNYFSDSSYLSEVFDSVTGALVDASAQLSHESAVEFEFVVQKWLGALHSVGFSQDTINTIAQGITYLATGDVEKLNSNESLNSLMAMAASRAAIPYAEILTEGLDATTTNDLLRSMVEYLQSIANNTDNNKVTKSAYTNLFGMNMTDLKAVSNLQTTDIENLHSEMLSYNNTLVELENQFGEVMKRTHISQLVDNIVDNAAASASTGIGNNPALYGMWKIFNVVEGLTGGIHLPAISVMGNMVDLSTFTIEGMAKTGIAGLGLMSQLLSGLFSGGGLNPFSLEAWGFEETTKRGSKMAGLDSGISSGFSESSEMSMTGSSSSDDVKTSSMSDKTDEAEKDSEITNKNLAEEIDIYQKIYEAIASDGTTVLEEVKKISGGAGGGGGSGGGGGGGSATIDVSSILTPLSAISGINQGILDYLSEGSIFDEFKATVGALTQISTLLGEDRVFVVKNEDGSSTVGTTDTLTQILEVVANIESIISEPKDTSLLDEISKIYDVGNNLMGMVNNSGIHKYSNNVKLKLTRGNKNTQLVDDTEIDFYTNLYNAISGNSQLLQDLMLMSSEALIIEKLASLIGQTGEIINLVGLDRIFTINTQPLPDGMVETINEVFTKTSDTYSQLSTQTTDTIKNFDTLSLIYGAIVELGVTTQLLLGPDRVFNVVGAMVDITSGGNSIISDTILNTISTNIESAMSDVASNVVSNVTDSTMANLSTMVENESVSNIMTAIRGESNAILQSTSKEVSNFATQIQSQSDAVSDSIMSEVVGITNKVVDTQSTLESITMGSTTATDSIVSKIDSMTDINKESSELVEKITNEQWLQMLNEVVTSTKSTVQQKVTTQDAQTDVSIEKNEPKQIAQQSDDTVDKDMISEIVTELLSRISNDGGLQIRFSNDQSTPVWVQSIGGF